MSKIKNRVARSVFGFNPEAVDFLDYAWDGVIRQSFFMFLGALCITLMQMAYLSPSGTTVSWFDDFFNDLLKSPLPIWMWVFGSGAFLLGLLIRALGGTDFAQFCVSASSDAYTFLGLLSGAILGFGLGILTKSDIPLQSLVAPNNRYTPLMAGIGLFDLLWLSILTCTVIWNRRHVKERQQGAIILALAAGGFAYAWLIKDRTYGVYFFYIAIFAILCIALLPRAVRDEEASPQKPT